MIGRHELINNTAVVRIILYVIEHEICSRKKLIFLIPSRATRSSFADVERADSLLETSAGSCGIYSDCAGFLGRDLECAEARGRPPRVLRYAGK